MCNYFRPHQTSSDQIWEGGTSPIPGVHWLKQCGGHCDQPASVSTDNVLCVCMGLCCVCNIDVYVAAV